MTSCAEQALELLQLNWNPSRNSHRCWNLNDFQDVKIHLLSASFKPSRLATADKVSLMVSFETFGNCFLRTSTSPAFVRSLPEMACLNAGRRSEETIFNGFPSSAPRLFTLARFVVFSVLLVSALGPDAERNPWLTQAFGVLMEDNGRRGGCIRRGSKWSYWSGNKFRAARCERCA